MTWKALLFQVYRGRTSPRSTRESRGSTTAPGTRTMAYRHSRLLTPDASLQTPKGPPEMRIRPPCRPGALHQYPSQVSVASPRPAAVPLAGALVVPRAHFPPRAEPLVRAEPAHVQSDLADHIAGSLAIDSGMLRSSSTSGAIEAITWRIVRMNALSRLALQVRPTASCHFAY
jgi:hypothetical protein